MKNSTTRTARRRPARRHASSATITVVSMALTIFAGLLTSQASLWWKPASAGPTESAPVADVAPLAASQSTVAPRPAYPEFFPQTPLRAALPAVLPEPTPLAEIAPQPATVDSMPAQLEAMKKFPELSRQGSPFNREFLRRVESSVARDAAFLQNAQWPLALAEEVAGAGFPSVRPAGDREDAAPNGHRVLLPSWPEWRFLQVYREGSDIVVPRAVATVFGHDARLGVIDPNDNGKCASGYHTGMRPGMLGCALPVSMARRSTVGSPFPKVPWLPWLTPVTITYNGRTITVPLVDNGPSAPKAGDSIAAGIDLTPATCLALGIPLEDIRRNRVAFQVSFRMPGAGRHVGWN